MTSREFTGPWIDELDTLEPLSLPDLHPTSGQVSERALLSAGQLKAERKELLKQRFAASPRMNRHQRRRRSKLKAEERRT